MQTDDSNFSLSLGALYFFLSDAPFTSADPCPVFPPTGCLLHQTATNSLLLAKYVLPPAPCSCHHLLKLQPPSWQWSHPPPHVPCCSFISKVGSHSKWDFQLFLRGSKTKERPLVFLKGSTIIYEKIKLILYNNRGRVGQSNTWTSSELVSP